MATIENFRAERTAPGSLISAASTKSQKSPTKQKPLAKQKLVGRIGPWQLVRLVNESDLARVYIARPIDTDSEKPDAYVLKVLRKEWWRDPQAIEMQRRAAWIGRTVSHPNLLPVLSAGVGQPPFYLASPRLEGRALDGLLKEEDNLPLPTKLWIVRQVAEGLAALHETADMIHADVKPGNVMVSPEGHATLIDLGFAHSPDEARHWSSRPVMGTLHYIAPEAITSSLAAEPRSDIYSLGVTLYQMLTQFLPFPTDDATELVRLHREQAPECVRHRVPDLPKPVASLVHRMMAKNPLRRPDSAREVAKELTRLEIECFGLR